MPRLDADHLISYYMIISIFNSRSNGNITYFPALNCRQHFQETWAVVTVVMNDLRHNLYSAVCNSHATRTALCSLIIRTLQFLSAIYKKQLRTILKYKRILKKAGVLIFLQRRPSTWATHLTDLFTG
jgi:hypothetical protein